jgi:hypothetical protein
LPKEREELVDWTDGRTDVLQRMIHTVWLDFLP